jgi:flagellar assembly protein FliH
MSLSDPDSKEQPQAELFKLDELKRTVELPAELMPEEGEELSGFQLMFDGDRIVDPRQQAAEQAERITSRAEQKVQEAEGQVAQIKKEAYDKGFEQGLGEGKAASQARIAAACDNLGRAVEAIDLAKANLLGNLEAELIALVQAVVDRIFLIEGAVHPELIKHVARSSISRLAESDTLTLTLCSSDMEVVEEFAPLLKKGMVGLKHVNLVPDDNLHPGDCKVISADAQVDSTLATRKERIFQILEDTLQSGQALDLGEYIDKTPPAVELIRQDEQDAKPAVTPADFTTPPGGQTSGGLEPDGFGGVNDNPDGAEDDLDW